ncbi:head completion/stabilization protein [Pseudomonas laurylsulfatiphila]|uniref:head completion/stabilization protein n=1 Tax=Pseudomonas laurylsulfatiphila TaxID=2011015 RepID=UPI00215EA00C|nr:head completion/stabilization protein [Pseudomonas laurylsulfatiphila]UVM06424.1 head completion/stabilization protein [Pseudomonas laurylsulfatiphila]
MSGFIATGSTAEAYVISNDGFWPDIDGATLRAAIRLDGSISDARLEVAAVNALIQVNQELRGLKASHQADGHAVLADVPADRINDESCLVLLYRRAIYCTAAAELSERYRSFDSTAEGNRNAEELTPSIDEYRRDARFAIRDLLGVGHCTVELI